MKSFLEAWKNAFGLKGVKKKYGICLGALLLTLLCSGCEFRPSQNLDVCVYGPPPMEEEDYDPSKNINADVYGPPEEFWDEDDEEEEIEEEEIEEIDPEAFHPADNMDVCVYGPPEDM